MAADVFAVLADPTRRHLVEALHDGERAVGDLVGLVDIEQPGVSRHLRILHDAGLVQVRAEGQRRLYSLRRESFAELDAWLQRYIRDVDGRLARLGRAVESRQGKVTK